ncbi:MAG TPA: HEAT repeat domain-containing protein [Candidatus Hypogeohydataceae bacterium YC40]
MPKAVVSWLRQIYRGELLAGPLWLTFVLCLFPVTSLQFSISPLKAEVTSPPTAEIERWIRQLYSPDVTIRSSAAISLLYTDHPAALESLLNILKSAPPPASMQVVDKTQEKEVLISVIKTFGFKGDDRAVIPLMELLQRDEPEVREAACQSLGRLRTHRAIEQMAVKLQEPKYTVVAKVLLIKALGQTRDKEAVEPLLALLGAKEVAGQPPTKELREAALESLSLLAMQSFGTNIDKWQAWWNLNKGKSREQWLADTVDRLEEANKELRTENESLKKEVAQKTIALLSEAVEQKNIKPLLEAMKQGHTDVRLFAIKEITKLDDSSVIPDLVVLLADKEKDVRASAVQALGEIGDEKAIDPLLIALKDEDALVREKAARALGKFRTSSVVDALIDSLKHDSTFVLIAACESLGQMGNNKAVDSLADLLSNEDARVRESSAVALGRLKDQRAVAPLVVALNDKEERVRWYAADSLGNLRDEQAVEPLAGLLSDKVARVREAAAGALGKIGSEKAFEPLLKVLTDQDKKVVEQASESLLGIKIESFDALGKLADVLYDNKDYTRASQVLERRLSQFSTSENHKERLWDSRLKLARIYYLQKDWQKAMTLYDGLSEYDKADMEIKVELAQCLKEMKQYDRLLELYGRWMKELPEQSREWWKGRVEVLNSLFEQGNYTRVAKIVDTFLVEDPGLGGPDFKAKFLELAERSIHKTNSTNTLGSKGKGLAVP